MTFVNAISHVWKSSGDTQSQKFSWVHYDIILFYLNVLFTLRVVIFDYKWGGFTFVFEETSNIYNVGRKEYKEHI